MQKIIKVVNEKEHVIQCTVADERWYVKERHDEETGLPIDFQFVPSVTWITGHYPKGVGFYKWLASKGWDESQAIKQAAGDRGSKVHKAIEMLLDGQEVPMDAKVVNPSTGQAEELTLEEYDCLLSFVRWFEKTKPTTIAREFVIWNDQYGYAGTVDYLCTIAGVPYLIDFKTSAEVWPEYELQVSAYKHALPAGFQLAQAPQLAILQIGYKRNKDGFKFTEVEDQFELFLAARQIWQKEASSQKPSKKDYPLALKLPQITAQPEIAEADNNNPQ